MKLNNSKLNFDISISHLCIGSNSLAFCQDPKSRLDLKLAKTKLKILATCVLLLWDVSHT